MRKFFSRIRVTIKALWIMAIYKAAQHSGLFIMPIERLRNLHDYVKKWDDAVAREYKKLPVSRLPRYAVNIQSVMVAILQAIDEYEATTKGKVWPDDAENLFLHPAERREDDSGTRYKH